MLAAMIDGLSESGAAEGAGAAGVRARRGAPRTTAGVKNGTNLASVMSIAGDVLGRRRPAALACRARASATPRSPRVGERRAAGAVRRRLGRRWRSPSPAPARTPPTSGPPRSSTATSTSSTARRSSSPPASAADAVVVWATLDKDARPGGDQVVRGRRRARPGMTRRAARAQARHPGLRHRDDHLRGLPGAGGEPPRLARRSTPSRASPARWRPSTTPARWSPRWPSAAPGRRST